MTLRLRRLVALALFAPALLHAQAVEEISLDSLLSVNVSTASRYEQAVQEVPASVTVVTAEEIEAAGYRTLAELLGGLRGFYVTHDHTRAYLGTRGFGRMLEVNNRVLVLLDGTPLHEPVYGAADVTEEIGIDLSLVERVEVVRGPGSVLYGTGAMFAVVNVITKAPPATEGVHADATVGRGYGRAATWSSRSWANGWRSVVSGIAMRSEGRDLYFPEFDAPETNDGWAIGRDGSRQHSALARLYRGGWTLRAFATDFERGIPTADFGTRFNAEAKDRTRTLLLEAEHERHLNARTAFTWRGYYRTGGTSLRYATQEDGHDLFYNTYLAYHSFRSDVLLQWDLRAHHRLVVGAQAMANPMIDVGARVERPDGTPHRVNFARNTPYHVLSLYAQDEFQVHQRLSLTVGLRGDVYSHAGDAVTPRAAVVYHPFAATTLKLLYGQAFRAPTTLETSYQGTLTYNAALPIVPNAGLNPERVTTRELVWEQRLGPSLTAVASAYDYAITGLIDVAVQLEQMQAQFQNRGRQEASGVEVGLDGRLGSALRGSLSYSYQRARQRGSAFVFNAPPHLFRSSAHARLRGFDLVAEARYDGGRCTLRGEELDGYWLVNAQLTAPPLLGARASLHVRNLLDAHYRLPGNRYHVQRSFRQPGRTVVARLAIRL